jgi:hypothetical protein
VPQIQALQKMVKSFHIMQERQRLSYPDAIQTDIPGLFQNPLRFIHGNTDHEENKKKYKRDKAN